MNLKYIFDQSSLNARKVIWMEFLCEFDFEIKHIKGKENKVIDSLNRKFHVVAMSVCNLDLRRKCLNALV
jgi:hypothetical protein